MLNIILLKKASDQILFDMQTMDNDIYTLLFRMAVNLVVLTILVRFLYFPVTRNKDYLFTYFLVGMIAFFLCFSLKKLNIDTGMGLSLFAIFGIIRYRTDTVDIKEMTYLFLTIGVSVFNALASRQISLVEMFTINFSVIALTFIFEKIRLSKSELSKSITYEKIELILPEKQEEMLQDLEARTGLKINHFQVGRINFLQDTAQVKIYYYE